MEDKKLLKEIGLSNYEIAVYLKLVEVGVASANTLYKESKVPFGRIYEVLNSLVNKGLVEVQSTRPKRYMARKPKLAFSNLLKKRRDELESQFQRTVEAASKIENDLLKRMPVEPKERAFWTVAVGNNEITEMMKYNFDDAEKELCIIIRNQIEDRKKQLGMTQQPEILCSLINAVKRGVKLRILAGENLKIPKNVLDEEGLKHLLSAIEIKIIGDVRSYFEVCDDNKVMIKIDNPANTNEILAAIIIYDIKLAKELKAKFEWLWSQAKPVILK
jgi:sugar-specific transcriptional regulator TrmB